MSLVKSPPLSQAQVAARRLSARRSTGPRTARGKARSRWNALQHGGCATHAAWSDEALQALGEDPSEFENLRLKLRACDGPLDDPLWAAQIDDLARLYWRRRRLERAWEVLAAQHEPSSLVAVTPEGERLLGRLEAVDRAVDRKTRLLLRLREAEARHQRELEQSARRRVRQQMQQLDGPDDMPTDEDLALLEAERLRLREQSARLQRQSPGFLDDFEEDASPQKPAERSEEVVEDKGAAGSIVTSDK